MKSLSQQLSDKGPVAAKRVKDALNWRLDNVRPNIHAWATWRGESPRIYLHNPRNNPVFANYRTDPPLTYSPYAVADACHWVNVLPRRHDPRKKHIYEIEHPLVMTRHKRLFMQEWHQIKDDRRFMHRLIRARQCRCVFTFSQGLVDHFKPFLDPELWPKLDFAYPAYPSQSKQERTGDEAFNILVISSRWSDKGLPEAMKTFEILRARHGAKVRLTLVSQAVPKGYVLPEGVTHHDVPMMSIEFKAQMYREADVLFLPCFSETAMCFVEAYAFGVPVVTTRIHHGDEFVQEGKTGFLIHAPVFAFSEGFGTRWKHSDEFFPDLQAIRERGELHVVVEESVDRLEEMISGRMDMDAMRRAAWEFHEERFSPRARNEKLLQIYGRALGKSLSSPKPKDGAAQ